MAEQTAKEIIIDLQVSGEEALNNIASAKKQLDELAGAQLKLKDAYKSGSISAEEFDKKMAAITATQKAYKDVVRANERELTNMVKSQDQAGDSLNAMRVKLANLNKEYADLSKAEREGARGKDLLNKINAEYEAVTALEQGMGDFRRQVGNYEKSAKTQLRELTQEIQSLALSLTQQKNAIQDQENLVATYARNLGTTSEEYVNAKQKLDEMTAAQALATQKMDEMEQTAGQMKDVIGDVNTRISNLANDERRIVALQDGVQALGAAYQVVQGAVAAAGGSTEKLVRIMAKMQIVQNTVNSLLILYRKLNKDSALMQSIRMKYEQIRLTLTKAYTAELVKQNAATAADTAGQTADAAATAANTAAHFSLRAAVNAVTTAMAANPIGAIIVGITVAVTALVAVVKKFRNQAKEAEEEARQFQKNVNDRVAGYREMAEAELGITQSYTDEANKLKALNAVIHNSTASYNEKCKAIAELQKIIPDYNVTIDRSGKIVRENIKAYDDYIAKLDEAAKAEGVYQALVAAYNNQALLQIEKKNAERQILYRINLMKTSDNVEYNSKKLDEELAALGQIEDEINKNANKIKQLQQQVTFVPNTKTTGVGGTKKDGGSGDDGKQETDEARKQYNELLKLRQNYYSELAKMTDNANKTATEKENERYEQQRQKIQDALTQATSLLGKDGYDQDAVGKLIADFQSQLVIVDGVHKDNMAKIKATTDEAFASLMDAFSRANANYTNDIFERIQAETQLRLDAMAKEEEETLASQEWTEEQKLEIQKKYKEKRERILEDEKNNEKEAWIGTIGLIDQQFQRLTSSFSSLFNDLAQDNEKFQEYAKATAIIEAIVTGGLASVQAILKATQSSATWVDMLVAIVTVTASVASIVGTIVSQMKNTATKSAPKFAGGGLIGGREAVGNEGTADNVPIMASNGEYIIKASKVKEYGKSYFDAINYGKAAVLPNFSGKYANGGYVNGDVNYDTMKAMMVEVMSEIQPVVSVKEITHTQNRVRIKENIR